MRRATKNRSAKRFCRAGNASASPLRALGETCGASYTGSVTAENGCTVYVPAIESRQ